MTEPVIDPRIEKFIDYGQLNSRYKLVAVLWLDPEESEGRNNCYINVTDPQGNRLVGEQVNWENGGIASGLTEEKLGDLGGINFGMTGTLGSYTIWCGDEDGSESDWVSGIGLGTPDEPWRTVHTGFVVTFVKGEPIPEPPPDPEPPDPEPPPEPCPDEPDWDLILAKLDEILAELQ